MTAAKKRVLTTRVVACMRKRWRREPVCARCGEALRMLEQYYSHRAARIVRYYHSACWEALAQ